MNELDIELYSVLETAENTSGGTLEQIVDVNNQNAQNEEETVSAGVWILLIISLIAASKVNSTLSKMLGYTYISAPFFTKAFVSYAIGGGMVGVVLNVLGII